MEPPFKDHNVIITGGTGFLGRAVVQRLVNAGARCEVTWIVEQELEDCAWRDQVGLHRVDCASEEGVGDLYGRQANLWASIHVVGGFAMAPLTETGLDDFQHLMRLNAQTCFLCCREAVRAMRRKAEPCGRIVNIAARPAVSPAGGMVAYGAAKAAVVSITQCVAEEVKNDGIAVNAVAPSIMDTPANRRAMPDAEHENWPKVDQVAETIAFLTSPANTLTSGAVVPVYGKM